MCFGLLYLTMTKTTGMKVCICGGQKDALLRRANIKKYPYKIPLCPHGIQMVTKTKIPKKLSNIRVVSSLEVDPAYLNTRSFEYQTPGIKIPM